MHIWIFFSFKNWKQTTIHHFCFQHSEIQCVEEWWFVVMVQKNHHSEFLTFFLAKNSCILLKNRLFRKFWRLQNLLRSLRIFLQSLQILLNNATQDTKNHVKKQEKVMVFLNHHYKPSLLKPLWHNWLEAKVMDCGCFSIFE